VKSTVSKVAGSLSVQMSEVKNLCNKLTDSVKDINSSQNSPVHSKSFILNKYGSTTNQGDGSVVGGISR